VYVQINNFGKLFLLCVIIFFFKKTYNLRKTWIWTQYVDKFCSKILFKTFYIEEILKFRELRYRIAEVQSLHIKCVFSDLTWIFLSNFIGFYNKKFSSRYFGQMTDSWHSNFLQLSTGHIQKGSPTFFNNGTQVNTEHYNFLDFIFCDQNSKIQTWTERRLDLKLSPQLHFERYENRGGIILKLVLKKNEEMMWIWHFWPKTGSNSGHL
jgi:hypothetical protein